MKLLAAAVLLLTLTHAFLPAALLALPLAFLAGRKTAIRQTGVGMVKTGSRRVVSGRLS